MIESGTDDKKEKLSKTWKVISPNNPNQTENQWGRPSKLTWFIEAFEEVLNESEEDVIYFTDDELRELCNDRLEETAQISDTTFKNWKAWRLEDNAEYKRFVDLYKKALAKQKRELFKSLKDDPQAWQRMAWIIERKFSAWNLKNINESKTEHSGTLSIWNVLNELWDSEIDLTK